MQLTGIQRRHKELCDRIAAKIGAEHLSDITYWYGAYHEVGCPNCGFDFERDGHPELNIWPHFTGACKGIN